MDDTMGPKVAKVAKQILKTTILQSMLASGL